ncbi:MAG: carboxypeptidase regulatory-like domain-containing protein [Ignavibacteria bacterium]|nr:carboxypeptidase regulatory-like domain-containing protein [Ignavibacteria bacterium]
MAKKTYTGVSDADGTWKVFNVPAGVYKIEAHAKDGFGDFSESSFTSATNVQYVGVGAYQTYQFSLARPISSDMVADASTSIVWRYTFSDEAMTIIKDSIAYARVTVQTRNLLGWSYIMSIVSDSTMNCASYLARGFGSKTPDGTGSFVTDYAFYPDFITKLGHAPGGRTYYLMIRPHNGNSGPNFSLDEDCLKPFVLPITL